MKEQSRNRRFNVFVEFKGESRLLVDVAEEIGIQYQTLRARIFIRKWSLEDALTRPVQKRNYDSNTKV